MKVYIAGLLTKGAALHPEEAAINRAKFFNAESQLLQRGQDPVNPLNLPIAEQTTWQECMKVCLHALIDCDAIYMLPGWQRSLGATFERQVALKLGLSLYEL